jgi:hypothetical protein
MPKSRTRKGYKPKFKTYKLFFADPEMDGLEVTARSIPVGPLLELSVTDPEQDPYKSVRHFADALVDWNIEDDDGNPVPANLEGLATLEIDFVLEVVRAWTQALTAVRPPLPEGSPSGGTSAPEVSIPMTPLDS